MLKSSGSEDTANNFLPGGPTAPLSCIITLLGVFFCYPSRQILKSCGFEDTANNLLPGRTHHPYELYH